MKNGGFDCSRYKVASSRFKSLRGGIFDGVDEVWLIVISQFSRRESSQPQQIDAATS